MVKAFGLLVIAVEVPAGVTLIATCPGLAAAGTRTRSWVGDQLWMSAGRGGVVPKVTAPRFVPKPVPRTLTVVPGVPDTGNTLSPEAPAAGWPDESLFRPAEPST
jgi:hypothetical protein